MSTSPAQSCLGVCICHLAELKADGISTASAVVGGVEITVTVVPVADARHPGREYTRCERDVLTILSDSPAPLTAPRVLAELERRGILHGESTVTHALVKLAAEGVIASSRRKPRGYVLPVPNAHSIAHVC